MNDRRAPDTFVNAHQHQHADVDGLRDQRRRRLGQRQPPGAEGTLTLHHPPPHHLPPASFSISRCLKKAQRIKRSSGHPRALRPNKRNLSRAHRAARSLTRSPYANPLAAGAAGRGKRAREPLPRRSAVPPQRRKHARIIRKYAGRRYRLTRSSRCADRWLPGRRARARSPCSGDER